MAAARAILRVRAEYTSRIVPTSRILRPVMGDLGRRTLGLGEPRYGSAAQIMERQAGNLGLAAGVGAR
jgi:hypothetical protein